MQLCTAPCICTSAHCRWGETQSHAPNQPNQIHTIPDTEPRRSRTKNPRQTSCIWFNRQPILLQSSPIKLSSQSLSPKPSEPNSIKTLILDSQKADPFLQLELQLRLTLETLYNCQFRTRDPRLSLYTDNSEIESGILS